MASAVIAPIVGKMRKKYVRNGWPKREGLLFLPANRFIVNVTASLGVGTALGYMFW